ncbi:MAG: hypothetical protein WAN48_09945 [Actinomycetes bacterium]
MTLPESPPPALRPTLDEGERQQIRRVVGPAADALLRPLRDARGRQFERLEFVGDSVLDLVLSVHCEVEPSCLGCRAVDGHVTRLVTDARLGREARGEGLGEWLEWAASDDRLADLVEACAAVSFMSGSWSQVVDFVSRVVHRLGDETEMVLRAGRGVDAAPARRAVGSAILELAAALTVFSRLPDVDEGVLSTHRAELHRVSRVAHNARRRQMVDGHGTDAAVSDRVEEALARLLLRAGADTALQEAIDVLVDQ